MTLSIRWQLLLAFGFLLVCMIVVGAAGLIQASRLNDHTEQLYADELLGTGQVAVLAQNLLLMEDAMMDHLLASDAARRAEAEVALTAADRSVEAVIETIRKGESHPQRLEAVEEFARAWTAYKQVRDALVLPISRAGKLEEAAQRVRTDLDPRRTQVQQALTRMVQEKSDSATQIKAENAAIYARAWQIILVIMAVAFVVGAITAQWMAQRIRRLLDA
ncbi:MAG: MCP four helix bundle domain-containing protein, partial [Anaerolineae bacterium]|nr:MCP four helix bundle domain-containing protein [Anaerolineae bacterium]